MPDVLYVGLQDDDKIVSFGIDAGSGKLVPRAETPAAGALSVLAVSPDRRGLYVGYRGTRERSNRPGERRTDIAGARRDPATAHISGHRPRRQIPPVGLVPGRRPGRAPPRRR